MFGWLNRDRKNPLRRLQRDYEARMKKARDLQRSGDIQGYAAEMAEADAIAARLDALAVRSKEGS